MQTLKMWRFWQAPLLLIAIFLGASTPRQVLLVTAQTDEVSANANNNDNDNDHNDPLHFLTVGDEALISEDFEGAIALYEKGIAAIAADVAGVSPGSPVVIVSLYTNLGTALSSMGQTQEAADIYKQAVLLQHDFVDAVEVEAADADGTTTESLLSDEDIKDIKDIAAQASFYLGMVYQELGNLNNAANAYAHAHTLDPWHWGALANLGALLQDELRNPADAIDVYNMAYTILTQRDMEPTDFPVEPRFILSQLQHRIGMVCT
jgi:tetratricopeptide (TPR) repeat protein